MNVKKYLAVETDKAIYNIQFSRLQMEITGRCNLICQHCRGAREVWRDMPFELIVKVVQFFHKFRQENMIVVVSGGEPLLHKRFVDILKLLGTDNRHNISLTTNGLLLKDWHLDLISNLLFKYFFVSVSIDGVDPSVHDSFHGKKGSFEKAVRAIRRVVERQLPNVLPGIRTTVHPKKIDDMFKVAEFAHQLGCHRVGFSAIMPSGRATVRTDLQMNREEKRRFLSNLYKLKHEYRGRMSLDTNDVLKCLFNDQRDIGDGNTLVFDGCTAGSCSFNVSANGDLTPCALWQTPIMNVANLTVEDIAEHYQRSSIVHNMLDMNLKGRCGECNLKYQCGGCRVRALAATGDYLAEDPHCWKHIDE